MAKLNTEALLRSVSNTRTVSQIEEARTEADRVKDLIRPWMDKFKSMDQHELATFFREEKITGARGMSEKCVFANFFSQVVGVNVFVNQDIFIRKSGVCLSVSEMPQGMSKFIGAFDRGEYMDLVTSGPNSCPCYLCTTESKVSMLNVGTGYVDDGASLNAMLSPLALASQTVTSTPVTPMLKSMLSPLA